MKKHTVKFIQLKIVMADIKPEIWRRVIGQSGDDTP